MNFGYSMKIIFGLLIAAGLVVFCNMAGNLLVKIPISKTTEKSNPPSINNKSKKVADLTKITDSSSISATAGKKLFRNCRTCHSAREGGKNGIGPNLWGVYEQPIGRVAKFRYSKAMKNFAGKWDFHTLDKFLTNPKEYLPGTKMSFSGINDEAKRKSLILYLKSLDKS